MATVQSGESGEGDGVLAKGREGSEGERVVIAVCAHCGVELPVCDGVIRCPGCGAALAVVGGVATVVATFDGGAIEIGASVSRGRGRR